MQTMEMIVLRKRRIVMAKKQQLHMKVDSSNKRGIWEMISSVTGNKSNESKYILKSARICYRTINKTDQSFVNSKFQTRLEILHSFF